MIIAASDDRPFRPSNWPERIAGNFASFKNRRLTYSPYVYPTLVNRKRCLFVDDEIEAKQPAIYSCLMVFVQDSGLKVYRRKTDGISKL